MTNSTKISIVILVVAVLAIPAISNAQYYYNYAMPFGSCTYHAYKLCVGSNIYWYSGCNQQQDLYQTCQNGQTCQYGQCVTYIQPAPNPTPVLPAYNPYFRQACYNNSVHWFDSLGAESGLYKNCNDNNSCTIDACLNNACVNTLSPECQPVVQPIPVTPSPTENIENQEIPTQVLPQENINQAETPAAVSEIPAISSSGFWVFIKRWYMWILAALVIVFLFIVVYRRLSSEA